MKLPVDPETTQQEAEGKWANWMNDIPHSLLTIVVVANLLICAITALMHFALYVKGQINYVLKALVWVSQSDWVCDWSWKYQISIHEHV